MNLITDFYQGLDTFNLIIFWSIVVVVALLLIFALILTTKNKKLKRIINNNLEKKNEVTTKDNNQDIPLLKEQEDKPTITELPDYNTSEEISEINLSTQAIPTLDKLEEDAEEEPSKFIAEEHVMEYNTDPSPIENNIKESSTFVPTGPYQRNVLKEMSLSQTSPIGIVKPNKQITQEEQLVVGVNKDNQQIQPEEPKQTAKIEQTRESKLDNKDKEKNYLEQVSESLSQAKTTDDGFRTSYELQQEEDAIISYVELMRKKDTIKIVDEEEAVISIEELLNKKKTEEKLYRLTEDEENDTFIKELKSFRNGL